MILNDTFETSFILPIAMKKIEMRLQKRFVSIVFTFCTVANYAKNNTAIKRKTAIIK